MAVLVFASSARGSYFEKILPTSAGKQEHLKEKSPHIRTGKDFSRYVKEYNSQPIHNGPAVAVVPKVMQVTFHHKYPVIFQKASRPIEFKGYANSRALRVIALLFISFRCR